MSNSNSYSRLLLCTLLTTCCNVDADLNVINIENHVIFKTATEFFKTPECASIHYETPLVLHISNPLFFCEEQVSSPTSFLGSAYSNFKTLTVHVVDLLFRIDLRKHVSGPSRVLLTAFEDSGGCDLGRKLTNIQNAGYSAVLLSTALTVQKLNKSLSISTEQPPPSIYAHLINPFDVEVFNKLYSNGYRQNQVRIYEELPNSKCNNQVPPLIRAKIRTFVDQWWLYLTKDSLVASWANKTEKKLKDIIFTLLAATILLGPSVVLIVYTYGAKPPDAMPYYEPRAPRPPPPPPPMFESSDSSESDAGDGPTQEELKNKHLKVLNISENDFKTMKKQDLKKIYNKRALEEHPDKHDKQDEKLQKRQTEKCQQINAAKDYLIKFCVDAS